MERLIVKMKTKLGWILSINNFLLFALPTYLFSFEYELTPLKISLFGAVNVKNNIVAYGDFGNYLFSTDLGQNWRQRFIGIYDEIRSIVNFNDTLFGITFNGYFIISTDGGLSWNTKNIEIPSNEKLLKILVTQEGIYVRGIKTLFKLDRMGNVEKTLFDPIFEPIYREWFEGNPDEVVDKVNHYDLAGIFWIRGKIVLNSKNFCDSGFIVIEPDLSNFKKILLPIEVIKEYKNCRGEVVFFPFKYDYIVWINDHLYYFDSTFTNFQYFFKDSLFMNFYTNDNEIRQKWEKVGGIPSFYFTIGDSLFIGRYSDSTKYDTLGFNSDGPILRPYPQFNIYSVNKYISEPKDTFVLQGVPFYDVYNAYYYALNKFYLSRLFFRIKVPSFVVNDSIWIYTGRNKFLLITNKCNSWYLVSYLSGKPRAILNDSTYFFVFQDNDITEVNRSSNGGNTFLPSKSYLEGYQQSRSLGGFYHLPYFFIDSTGKGFLKGLFKFSNFNNIYKTENFWESYYPVVDFYDSLQILYPGSYTPRIFCYSSNIVKFNDCYLLAYHCDQSDMTKTPKSRFLIVDTSMTFTKSRINVSGCRVLHILSDSNPEDFIYFALVSDSIIPMINWLEIRRTTDAGKTFKTLVKLIDYGENIVQFYQHNTDSVFFTTSKTDRLYLYDRKSNELKILWSSENGDFEPKLMVISDRFYIVGRGLFLENTDRSDLTQWRQG
ncbi:MAG: WD40/YVTN/BNR-like repeat-containing protein, partial [Candidatus Kapaibacteriota bacterium]